jgi:flagellar biosynthesis protein FlhB
MIYRLLKLFGFGMLMWFGWILGSADKPMSVSAGCDWVVGPLSCPSFGIGLTMTLLMMIACLAIIIAGSGILWQIFHIFQRLRRSYQDWRWRRNRRAQGYSDA